jgi:hypothetical protein
MTGLQTLSSKWPRDRQRHGLRADREMHENVAAGPSTGPELPVSIRVSLTLIYAIFAVARKRI